MTLAGPGYGECVLVHLGGHRWVIVDSCLDTNREPVALSYFRHLGLDPADVVRLVVATHWHDDHIRGLADVVHACKGAIFCCASVLVDREFLGLAAAIEGRQSTRLTSGVRELVSTRSLLADRSQRPHAAIADRLIFSDIGCKVWSLSPTDSIFDEFLQRMSREVHGGDGPRGRLTAPEPNDTSVVLLIEVGDTAVLLGSDLERPGWLTILDSDRQVGAEASVFKVPHHGSENAHEDRVWSEMLTERPVAALTPWRRGGGVLPTPRGIGRILGYTDQAYITAPPVQAAGRRTRGRSNVVRRAIRESGVRIRPIELSTGMVQMRKTASSSEGWRVTLLGTAQQLV